MAMTDMQRARDDASATALDEIDVSRADLWTDESHLAYFERLRRDEPVHYCRDSLFGPYWSVTKYRDIMAVDTNPAAFSSEASLGGIVIDDQSDDFKQLRMFIAMDPPEHSSYRNAVSPVVSPLNLRLLEPVIRERVCRLLDDLPIGEPFNWVERVSIELTTQMLATLFDFPFEDRRKLTFWSDVATMLPGPDMPVKTYEEKFAVVGECLEAFTRLWNERVNAPPRNDFISALAHAEATRNMTPMEFLGNLILLIVGGNDTTRNTITGSVLALHENPGEFQKLRANPALIPSMVSEAIRWQTPLAHMRRTAIRDVEIGGKQISKGDKVVMWYISGNRDGEAIEDPDSFIVDRARPQNHLSFGFGIHRCMGNRLAEMQLRIVWEEILQRFSAVEVVEAPVRVPSPFVRGFSELVVRLAA